MKRAALALAVLASAFLLTPTVQAAPDIPSVVSHNIQATYASGATADPGIVLAGKERGGYTYQYVVCKTQPSFWNSADAFEGTKKSHDAAGNPVALPSVSADTECAWRVFYKYPGQFQLADLLQVPFTVLAA